jgi:hypothetical protein
MNNLDYYRAVLFGAVVATFFLSMFYVFTREDEPQKPQSNFEVVDTYKGCDVVRYTNPNLANYQYFLDCRK